MPRVTRVSDMPVATAIARCTLWLVMAAAMAGCGVAPAPRAAGSGSVALGAPVPEPGRGLRNFGVVRKAVLFRGAQPDVDAGLGLDGYGDLLARYKVRTIVDLMNEPIDHWIKRRQSDCARMTPLQRNSFKYVAIPAYEPFPTRANLARFLRVVARPDNQPVFVHCVDGENRTGAMIAGFRVVEDLWSPVDAKAEMTNFAVLRIWQGVNDRFIDALARDRDALRRELLAPEGGEATVVDCGAAR